MFKISRFTASALICALTALGTGTALAQAASKLDCNKCVDAGDVAKKAVTKQKIKKGAVSKNRIEEGAVDQARLSTALQTHFAERESFYITLDGDGTTATIATHGPFTYFARCVVNDTGEDRIEIVATSSVSGWLEEDENDFGSSNPPLAAGVEVIAWEAFVNPSGGVLYTQLSEVSAIAPDGSYLALDGESGGVGLNLFGHDCLVVGNIYRITGTL